MSRTKYAAYSLIALGAVLIASGLLITPIASAATDTTVVEYDSLSPQAQSEFDDALDAQPSLHVINYHDEEFSYPAIAVEIDELRDRNQRVLLAIDGDYYRIGLAAVHEHPKIVLEGESIAYEDIPDNHTVVQFEEIDNHRTAYERAIETGYWEMHAHDTRGGSDDHENGHGDHDHHDHHTKYIEYEGDYYEITHDPKDGINGHALTVQEVDQPTYEAYAPGASIAGVVAALVGVIFWYRDRD